MRAKSENRSSTGSARVYVFIILLFALVLRLIYFFGILEGDDTEYVFHAHYIIEHGLTAIGELDNIIHAANRPGQYLPAAFFFKILGISEFSAALFPLICSLVTCYLLYKIAKLLVSEKAGLLAAYLWAVFPLSIFLATQLDPEGPLTMTTTAAVYCLMLATRREKPSVELFALSVFFIFWAFTIKQSSAPIVFVLGAWLLYTIWQRQSKPDSFFQRFSRKQKKTGLAMAILLSGALLVAYFINQPSLMWVNGTELSAIDTSQVIELGRMNPTTWQDLGNKPYFTLDREPYLPDPLPNTLANYPTSLRFTLLDAYMPLLFLGIAYPILTREQSSYFGLIWLAVLFFYLEWGPYPNGLGDVFVYLPIPYWISPDNLLYACIPIVLVVGASLSEHFRDIDVKRTILWAVPIVLLSSFFLENPATSTMVSNLIAVCVLLITFFALIGSAVSSYFAHENNRRLMYAGVAVLVGIASLNHALHYHVSYLSYFSERRANLKAVNAFLAEQTYYPIAYPSDGLAGWLDIYTGYQYGYSRFEDEYTFPKTRLTSSEEQIREFGGYILGEGCGQPAADFTEWPFAEFGDPTSESCISLFRVLPAAEVLGELTRARTEAHNLPSQDNILRYIAAAANTKDLSAFIDGLSQSVSFFPETTPIVEASGILVGEGLSLPGNRITDLLAQYIQGEVDWDFGPRLIPRTAAAGDQAELEVRIQGSTEEIQPIIVPLELKGNTAYVLEVEFTSFAPIDWVRFLNPQIPDSHPDGWRRELSPTSLQIVFITPSTLDETETVKLELARVFDKGDFQIRKVNLIEIRPE